MRNKTLEKRVRWTLLSFGVATAVITQLVAHVLHEKVEHAIWRSALFALSSALPQGSPLLTNGAKDSTIRIWNVESKGDTLPPELRDLSSGFHEVIIGGVPFNVLVEDFGMRRRVLGFDVLELERKEILLGAGTLVAFLLLFVLLLASCRSISHRLLAPIHHLADKVTHIDPAGQDKTLADNFSGSELAVIADAVDRFVIRIRDFIEREKEFATLASHELRTPIAVIAGALDVIDTIPDLPPRSLKPLARVRENTRAMEQLCTALLQISREPRTALSVAAPCDVCALLPGVIESHRHLLTGKRIDVRLSTSTPLVALAPRPIVTIVISNLLRNAIEHTSQGTIEVASANGRLEVRDEGSGISASQLERLNSTTGRLSSAEVNGFGIGLYIVRKLCAQFGWRLTLLGNPNGGTTAVLRFGSISTPNREEGGDGA